MLPRPTRSSRIMGTWAGRRSGGVARICSSSSRVNPRGASRPGGHAVEDAGEAPSFLRGDGRCPGALMGERFRLRFGRDDEEGPCDPHAGRGARCIARCSPRQPILLATPARSPSPVRTRTCVLEPPARLFRPPPQRNILTALARLSTRSVRSTGSDVVLPDGMDLEGTGHRAGRAGVRSGRRARGLLQRRGAAVCCRLWDGTR